MMILIVSDYDCVTNENLVAFLKTKEGPDLNVDFIAQRLSSVEINYDLDDSKLFAFELNEVVIFFSL